jgi:uncharacterized protein YchJ
MLLLSSRYSPCRELGIFRIKCVAQVYQGTCIVNHFVMRVYYNCPVVQNCYHLLNILYPECDAKQDAEIRIFRDTVKKQLEILDTSDISMANEKVLGDFKTSLQFVFDSLPYKGAPE